MIIKLPKLQLDQGEAESKIKETEAGLRKIKKELDICLAANPKTEEDIKENDTFKYFLIDLEENAQKHLDNIIKLQENLNKEILSTSVFFGEDQKTFKYPDFLKQINDFISTFKKAYSKFSTEEAAKLKKQLKEEKKNNLQKSKIENDIQKIGKNVARQTVSKNPAIRMTVAKNEKIRERLVYSYRLVCCS